MLPDKPNKTKADPKRPDLNEPVKAPLYSKYKKHKVPVVMKHLKIRAGKNVEPGNLVPAGNGGKTGTRGKPKGKREKMGRKMKRKKREKRGKE